MQWGDDIYKAPEKHDCEIVAEFGDGGGYEWDTFVVWRDTVTGVLGYGSAAGCSCSSFSDDFQTRADVRWARNLTEVEDAIIAWARSDYDSQKLVLAAERMGKMRQALQANGKSYEAVGG